MLAVDTNVVVRFLIIDDSPAQSQRALDLLNSEHIWIATTVLLEAEWVLRRAYGLERNIIAARLRDIAGLPDVTVENVPLLKEALSWFEQGMDFADALHLAAMEGCDAMISFDSSFAKSARKCKAPQVRAP